MLSDLKEAGLESLPGGGAEVFSDRVQEEMFWTKSDSEDWRRIQFRDKLGDVPLGGCFCNGEIGPVSGTTFLHGYTSSFGLFRPKL